MYRETLYPCSNFRVLDILSVVDCGLESQVGIVVLSVDDEGVQGRTMYHRIYIKLTSLGCTAAAQLGACQGYLVGLVKMKKVNPAAPVTQFYAGDALIEADICEREERKYPIGGTAVFVSR